MPLPVVGWDLSPTSNIKIRIDKMPYRLAYKANLMEDIPQLTLPGVGVGGTQTLAHKSTIHTRNPLKR